MGHKATIIEMLPEDLRETVEEDVRAGEFADADEAIRNAIVSQHERIAFRRSLIEAEQQIDRGELVTPEESDAEIERLARTLGR